MIWFGFKNEERFLKKILNISYFDYSSKSDFKKLRTLRSSTNWKYEKDYKNDRKMRLKKIARPICQIETCQMFLVCQKVLGVVTICQKIETAGIDSSSYRKCQN